MTNAFDLSTLSDEELTALRDAEMQRAQSAPPTAPLSGEPETTKITVRLPGARNLSDMSDDELRAAYEKAKKPGYTEDVVKSLASGAAKGAANLVALPGEVSRLVDKGVALAGEKLGFGRGSDEKPAINLLPTSDKTKAAVESVTGPLHKPQTLPGKYAESVGEFLPGAVAGPGGAVRNAMNFAVLPGIASEAAGQATHGSAAEPYVRAGAALATGGAAALLNRPAGAKHTLAQSAEGATPADLHAAEQLFLEAEAMGLPITRMEAVQAVTNGATKLGDLQRVIEGSGGLKPFFAERPAQVEQAGRRAIDTIAPPPANPSGVGPAVGEAAEETVNAVRGAINQAAEPFYSRAATVRLSPQEITQVRAIPGFEEARNAVRGDPQLNRYVANLPDDSVGFLNEVKKYLDQQAKNAGAPLAQNPNMQRAAGYGRDAEAARNIGVNASTDYASALGLESVARERFLDPLLRGPLGKLAERDIPTQKAIEALFPKNPLPNSADEISTAVTALAQRRPDAARQLVRAHVESVFNQATRSLQGGPNQFGGATFASAVRGNPQGAENLEAAIRALPNGDQTWAGFDRFLQVLEAQGTRQRIGSQTAFNQEMQSELRRGGLAGDTATLALGAGVKLPQKVKDSVERWRLGRGVDQLARLATDPAAGSAFRQLAASPVGSQRASSATRRLLMLGAQASYQEADSAR